MFLPPYQKDQLHFAFRCDAYFRWHTYQRKMVHQLREITAEAMESIRPDIRISEIHVDGQEVILLAGFRPSDSIATVASKIKGAVSCLTRCLLGPHATGRILGGGYFAATAGKLTSLELDQYLQSQAEHHGYDDRYPAPPVWVQSWPDQAQDEQLLQAHHSATRIGWHLVLCTCQRHGVFTAESGKAVSRFWNQRSTEWRVRMRNVSFVPDHVHLKLQTHPSLVPADLALVLLNETQQFMRDEFPAAIIRAGVPRLWIPGAYVGTYGEFSRAQLFAYLRRIRSEAEG